MSVDLNLTQQRLVDECLQALQGLPGVRAEVCEAVQLGEADLKCDEQVVVRVGGKVATLLTEAKKEIYPRDARQMVWRSREIVRRSSHPVKAQQQVYFLIARSISPGAKDILRNERVGYYDSGGSLFLPASNIYVCVDKPLPKGMSRSIRSVFSGRRAQVLHAILLRNGESFGVTDIAKQARVSAATASQVLKELEKFDWVVSYGKGPTKRRHLQEPGALLDAWVKQMAVMPPLSMRRYFVPTVRAGSLAERFAEACAARNVDYAITHEEAGQQYAPFLSAVSQVRCRLLFSSAAEQVLSELDARQVDQGANLAIIETLSPGELLFRRFVNGMWLASAVQVYLDLMRGEGRANEMARHLREEVIGF